MNFTISKSEFYNSLFKIIGVIPQKTTISILSCILLDLKDNLLNMTGTDLEISVSTSLPVEGSEDGSVAIPAKLLSEIVRELPDVPLHISSEDGNKIVISTDKGTYKISTQSVEDFPKIDIESGEFVFSLDGKVVKRIIDKTGFAVSNDEMRPALTGINMEIFQDELRFVATDGHRLVRMNYTNFSASEENQRKLIIPTKTLNLLLRNLNGDESVTIQTNEDHIVFKLENALIYSKLISGTYPNYERVIPTDNDKQLHVDKDLFISALRRVALFSNSLTHQVRVILTPNEMTIKSEDIEFGAEGKEVIPISFNGDWLQIGYNSSYLLDILKHLDTPDVIFDVKDSISAAIVHPSTQNENEDVILLLMPIRINEETSEENENVDSE